jgi:hypothetical protein
VAAVIADNVKRRTGICKSIGPSVPLSACHNFMIVEIIILNYPSYKKHEKRA